MITAFDKAIAGLFASGIVFGLAHFGFNVDPAISAELSAVITGLVVYLVPNKVAQTPTG